MPLFAVNKKLLPLKVHYFLFNAGIAPSITFGSTIAKQIGYSAITVGCMYTSMSLFALFAKVIFGAMADKGKIRKLMLSVSAFVCLCCSFTMIFVSTSPPSKRVTILCHQRAFISSCNDLVPHSRIYKLMHSDEDGVVNCQLVCQTNPSFATELCNTWKVESFCTAAGVTNHLDTLSATKRSFAGKSSTIDPESFGNVTFAVKLPKKHFQRINNCIYMTVEEAQFMPSTTVTFPTCIPDLNIPCAATCENSDLMEVLGNGQIGLAHDMSRMSFWTLYLIYVINWCAMALTCTLTDTICFDLLGDSPQKFGVQRMFGAIGWGSVTLLCGSLIDWFSGDTFQKNYAILFYLSAAILILDLFVINTLQTKQEIFPAAVLRDVRILFLTSRTRIFTVFCLLTGIFMGVSWNFLFWHLEDISGPEDLKWSKTIQGLDSLFITVLGELPFFLISGWILKKLGYVHTMSVILFACSLRLLLYSSLTSPIWVLPVELISGFTFSMCYVIIASYSSYITIPGTETTVQGLFGAMFDSLGVALGGLIGGTLYHHYQGAGLFGTLGFISLIAAVLHVIAQWTLKDTSMCNAPSHHGKAAHYATPNDAITILEQT